MTAVDLDALDKLRSTLADAMASGGRGNTYAQWAATILPVVEQFANERAAAELRAAADAMVWPNSQNCGPELRDRADALDPS